MLLLAGSFSSGARLLHAGRSCWTILQHPLDWDPPPSIHCRRYCLAREARFMKKLVTGTNNTKRKWFAGEAPSKALKDLSFLMQGQSGYRETTPKQKSGRTIRRVGVLSTVFMEKITDLLATGEVSTEILGLGLEITQVKISSDFTCINVYWHCTQPEKEAQLETTLLRISGHLRHILSQLRVIGEVPPIIFVKDTKHSRLLEVERILSTLDFGEDYEPTPLGHNYKVSMSAQKHKSRYKQSETVSESLGQSLQSLEDGGEPSKEDEEESCELPPPPSCPSSASVRQDMLGLDWDAIMGTIKLEVARTRRKEAAQNRPEVDAEQGVEESVPPRSRDELLEEVTRNVNRQKEFMEFLKQRRILRSREEKRHSTAAVEREFLAQEKESRRYETVLEIRERQEPEDYLEDEDETYQSEDQGQGHHHK